MPAKKKRHVEMSEVKHQAANIRVQIFYDRSEQVFDATYADQRYTAKTEGEVRNLVYTAIEETITVPWTPIIRVGLMKSFNYSSSLDDAYFIGFHLDRQWVTQFPNGQFKCCHQWEGKERGYLLDWCKDFDWDTERDGEFHPPCKRVWYSDTNYFLPYSDELWEKLLYMQEKIKELRSQLISLFGDQEGLHQLLTTPWLALPQHAGEKEG